MSRISDLFRLQELDLERERWVSRQAEIDRALADDANVQAAQAQVAHAHNQLNRARAQAQTLEHQMLALTNKIRALEQRLYGGRVSNPKELRDLQADVQAHQRRRAALEEQQFAALIESETAETQLAAAQHQLQTAETAWHTGNANLRTERAQIAERLAGLDDERTSLANRIRPEDMSLYQRLRASKNGRALARLDDGVCNACWVEPSATLAQQARRGQEPALCPNCGRILYA